MTKRELIDQLEALNLSDDTEVILFDWQKSLDNADDEGTLEGVYTDFEVIVENENPTPEQTEDYRIRVENDKAELTPVILLSFDNYDISEITEKSDRELLFNLAGQIAGTAIYSIKYPLDGAAQEKIHNLNSTVAYIAKDLFEKLDEQI